MSDFPWLKSYPDFVNKEADLSYNSLVEIFDNSVKRYGVTTAYKNMDVEITFDEVNKHVDLWFGIFKTKPILKKGTK
jgi:long-chain acyl-CoA synthetase